VDDEESRKREESEIGNNTVHQRYAPDGALIGIKMYSNK